MTNGTTRRAVPTQIAIQVLTEAGYRCAVPTCRNILALDLHHCVEVSEGGDNSVGNLIALCPTCHALFHRGTIHRSSIYAWKAMLVALGEAFDKRAVDDLLFLAMPTTLGIRVSGDAILHYSRLMAAGLASFRVAARNGPHEFYNIGLTDRGAALVTAWRNGDREALKNVLSGPVDL